MNGKQAKKLRRIAMGLAATFDQAGRKIHPNGHVGQVHKHTVKRQSTLLDEHEAGEGTVNANVPPPQTIPSVTHHNRPDSLRQIYRTIKKGVVSGKIGG